MTKRLLIALAAISLHACSSTPTAPPPEGADAATEQPDTGATPGTDAGALPGTGTAGSDASSPDTGSAGDAGSASDAGSSNDAATLADAATAGDAGSASDGGSSSGDGGVPFSSSFITHSHIPLEAIAFGNGLFVGVAPSMAAISTDGVFWTHYPLHLLKTNGNNIALHAVTYSASLSKWFAAGDNGTIISSADGKSWTRLTSGTTADLFGIAASATRVVATGNAVTVNSLDGATWTPGVLTVASSAAGNVGPLVYGNNLFVAIDGGFAWTSVDGAVFTRNTIGSSFSALTYAKGLFVVTGLSVYTSPNGTSWTQRTVSGTGALALTSVAGSPTLFAALGAPDLLVTSTDGITWTRASSGNNSDVRCLAYGNGVFAGAGAFGSLVSSADGLAWTESQEGRRKQYTRLAYGNSKWIALGYEGFVSEYRTAPLLVSTDNGATWTYGVRPAPRTLDAVAYGNSLYVAVGYGGVIVTSPDAVTWTPRVSNTAKYIHDIVYAGGKFVATADFGDVLRSTDGITWSVVTTTTDSGYGVGYGAGLYVTVGERGAVWSSPDAITWTKRTISATAVPEGLVTVAYGNGTFVTSGIKRTFTSPDGITWTERSQSANPNWFSIMRIRFLNGQFVGVHENGLVRTSSDGVTWTELAQPPSGSVPAFDIEYANSTYVMTTESSAMLRSTDLLAFKSFTLNVSNDVEQLHRVGGKYLAMEDGSSLTSTDALHWTRGAYQGRSFAGVASSGTVIVAVDRSDAIRSSSDGGATWTTFTVPNQNQLVDVLFANGRFTVVGIRDDKVFTSTDGLTWTDTKVLPILSLAYGNNTYVETSGNGAILSSADGLNGTAVSNPAPVSEDLYSVAYGNGRFVATGDKGSIVMSTSGALNSWTKQVSGNTRDRISKVIFAGQRFVAGGKNSYLATSFDGQTWTPYTMIDKTDITTLLFFNGEVLYNASSSGIGHLVP